MGRTALYRDPVPWRPARAQVQLETDALLLDMPDGRTRRHPLDGVYATTADGFFAERTTTGYTVGAARVPRPVTRRFVRMLILERDGQRNVVITPPDQGAVAPSVVRVPEAPAEAAVVDLRAWEALADWLLGGGRLSALSVADLAQLACIATPQFAVLIGEVAAQRALEHVWDQSGPLRGGSDLDSVLQPLADAAKHSTRASEALVSALSHAAGASRRRRSR